MPRISLLRNKEVLRQAIETSFSAKEVLEKLGLRAAGGNYRTLQDVCLEYGLEYPKAERDTTKAVASRRITDEEIFVVNSTYANRTNVKKRMFKMGIPNICNRCGQEPWWNGLPLTLTLEHINGVFNDNRLENLEILCGHCHSQTPTFAGRGGKLRDGESRRTIYLCLDCPAEIRPQSKRCVPCDNKKRSKIEYPSVAELKTQIRKTNVSATARSLGVSDIAVRKHLEKLGVDVKALRKKSTA